MHSIMDAYIPGWAPWKNSHWMEQGMAMGMICRRKVIMTDASKMSCPLWEGKPLFGHWLKAEKGLHINCLEMLEVCRAYQFFLPDLRGHEVLIHSDNMYVMWNRQGGLSSKRLFILVERLLEWAQLNLRSLRAAHIPANWTRERTCYLRALSPQKSGCSIPRRFRGFGWSLVQI